jgi:hypothetical protein
MWFARHWGYGATSFGKKDGSLLILENRKTNVRKEVVTL